LVFFFFFFFLHRKPTRMYFNRVNCCIHGSAAALLQSFLTAIPIF
jgi:hypothetical protein